ncbi:MAG: hypothetical protein WA230_07870 [Xanthobacteraceae bacterium]
MYQESQKENAGKRQTKDQHCAKGGSYTHDALIPWRYVRKMKRTTAVRNEDVNFTLSNKLKDRRIHGIRAWDPRPGVEDFGNSTLVRLAPIKAQAQLQLPRRSEKCFQHLRTRSSSNSSVASSARNR